MAQGGATAELLGALGLCQVSQGDLQASGWAALLGIRL